jgi:hypothetical protein
MIHYSLEIDLGWLSYPALAPAPIRKLAKWLINDSNAVFKCCLFAGHIQRIKRSSFHGFLASLVLCGTRVTATIATGLKDVVFLRVIFYEELQRLIETSGFTRFGTE